MYKCSAEQCLRVKKLDGFDEVIDHINKTISKRNTKKNMAIRNEMLKIYAITPEPSSETALMGPK